MERTFHVSILRDWRATRMLLEGDYVAKFYDVEKVERWTEFDFDEVVDRYLTSDIGTATNIVRDGDDYIEFDYTPHPVRTERMCKGVYNTYLFPYLYNAWTAQFLHIKIWEIS